LPNGFKTKKELDIKPQLKGRLTRRKCLDHIVVFGERHLRHALLSYLDYYNGAYSLIVEQGRTDITCRRGRGAHSVPSDPG
jgi:hypothetical protein